MARDADDTGPAERIKSLLDQLDASDASGT
jgi:hypothetical protein